MTQRTITAYKYPYSTYKSIFLDPENFAFEHFDKNLEDNSPLSFFAYNAKNIVAVGINRYNTNRYADKIKNLIFHSTDFTIWYLLNHTLTTNIEEIVGFRLSIELYQHKIYQDIIDHIHETPNNELHLYLASFANQHQEEKPELNALYFVFDHNPPKPHIPVKEEFKIKVLQPND